MSKPLKMIRKHHISPDHQEQFINFLLRLHVDDPDLHAILKEKAQGYLCNSLTQIADQNTLTNPSFWFVNSGMVICIMTDYKKVKVTTLTFKAGDVAMIPQGMAARGMFQYYLLACPNTHLMGFNRNDLNGLCAQYPDLKDLYNKVLKMQIDKFKEHAELGVLEAKARIQRFFQLYPEVEGPDKAVDLRNKYQGSYLGLNRTYFSRMLATIKNDKTES